MFAPAARVRHIEVTDNGRRALDGSLRAGAGEAVPDVAAADLPDGVPGGVHDGDATGGALAVATSEIGAGADDGGANGANTEGAGGCGGEAGDEEWMRDGGLRRLAQRSATRRSAPRGPPSSLYGCCSLRRTALLALTLGRQGRHPERHDPSKKPCDRRGRREGLGRGPTLWPSFGRGASSPQPLRYQERLVQREARGWGLSQAPGRRDSPEVPGSEGFPGGVRVGGDSPEVCVVNSCVFKD